MLGLVCRRNPEVHKLCAALPRGQGACARPHGEQPGPSRRRGRSMHFAKYVYAFAFLFVLVRDARLSEISFAISMGVYALFRSRSYTQSAAMTGSEIMQSCTCLGISLGFDEGNV